MPANSISRTSKQIRVLIADDEPLVRLGVRQALARMPEIAIVGECENGTQVLAAVAADGIDLLLLDIHLPDYSGIELVRVIGPEAMPLVIFVTAYDHYAVSAFELNAVDYVLKPFDEERLLASVNRATGRLAERGHNDLAERLSGLLREREPKWATRLSVRGSKGFELVPVESIDWIEAADNYVQLHCGTRSLLLAGTMSNVQERLDPQRFARVHRGRIVNISRIKTVAPLVNGTYELLLEGGLRLTTGRQYRTAILEILGAAVHPGEA